jgi:hypothetical protein
MIARLNGAFVAALITTMPLPPAASPAETAAARMRAELTRLERDVRASAGDQAGPLEDAVGRARKALDAGRLYQALEELQGAWIGEAAWRFAAERKTIQTLEQFKAEWQRIGQPGQPGAPPPGMPAAASAIAIAAASRASATWRASLPYAEDAGLAAGLYYLGESRAFVDFATFAASLPFERASARAPVFQSIEPWIDELETEAAVLHEKTTGDRRRGFIFVNVALKIARGLDTRQQYAAAIYQYLAAKHRLAATTVTSDPGEGVLSRIDATRKRLDSARDHSIAELFLQRASTLADTGDPENLRVAAAIVDRIVPEYLGLADRR